MAATDRYADTVNLLGDGDLRAALGNLLERLSGMRHFTPDAQMIEVLAMRPDIGLDEAVRLNDKLWAALSARHSEGVL